MRSGIDPVVAIFLILLTAKLTGLVDWSWWIVAAPIWVPWSTAFLVGMIDEIRRDDEK